jgi:hypothetical protein
LAGSHVPSSQPALAALTSKLLEGKVWEGEMGKDEAKMSLDAQQMTVLMDDLGIPWVEDPTRLLKE